MKVRRGWIRKEKGEAEGSAGLRRLHAGFGDFSVRFVDSSLQSILGR